MKKETLNECHPEWLLSSPCFVSCVFQVLREKTGMGKPHGTRVSPESVSTQYLAITHPSLPACAATQLPTCPSQPQGCHASCHCFWRETNHMERNQKKGSSEEDRLIIVPGLCQGLRARSPICFPTIYCLAHKTGDLSMASLPAFIYLFMRHLCPGALY